jgi:NTP pyrophosphatase (non-canonical NTP hydrolase)
MQNETKIENGIIGLFGEGGELADIYKKSKYQGHPMNREKMIEELGDVLFYCAMIATGLRTTLDKVAEQNIEKLMKRYPDGFTPERSMNREPEEPVVEIVEAEPEFSEIDVELANQIWLNGVPVGKFYLRNREKYIALDNTSGELWSKEFSSYEKMASWLRGGKDFQHEE